MFGMPPDTKFLGPLLKVYEAHTEVGGLRLPTRYDTWRGGHTYGMHWARNYRVDQPFDEARTRLPEDGVVDRSEAARR